MKNLKIKSIQGLVLLSVLSLIITGCKKKDSNGGVTDLLTNATEYTGTYPAPAKINYVVQGKSFRLTAFPGQMIAFFKMTASQADASQLIAANGGSILAQIPSIGYYFIGIDSSQTSSFINTMQANVLVDAVIPNVISYPKSGVVILDQCGYDHGQAVQSTLQNCAGTLDECEDVTLGGGSDDAPLSKQIPAIINEANKNNGGTTLINLSFNSGLDTKNPYDYATLDTLKKIEARDCWFTFMYGILKTIAVLPPQYRENLVITIAAGNENMPLGDLLEYLRTLTGIADVLDNNVLIVSTDNIPGIHANFAHKDPDVVVMNNSTAWQGTSLAAPCAMGYIQAIMSGQGVSAKQALRAMKLASLANPDREVLLGDALTIAGSIKSGKIYVGGPFSLIGSITWDSGTTGICTVTLGFEMKSVVVSWDGTTGTLNIPAVVNLELISGNCSPAENNGTDSKTMTGNLSGSNTNITGSAMAYFKLGTSPFLPLTLEFKGNKNTSGDLAGTFSTLSFTETVSVVLKHQ
jgi:hypothetical protein